MNYYEVWVRSHRYQNNDPLTYSSDKLLPIGSIVTVELQKEKVLAFVDARVKKPSFRCKPITTVHPLPPLPGTTIHLFHWMKRYYPSPIGPLAQLGLPATITKNPEIYSSAPAKIKSPSLNQEQSNAVAAISSAGSFLLHGHTGSGKTRVYAALAAQALSTERSAIILCPEISLTPQLAENIEQLLHIKPVVFHSKMTAKQKSEAWLYILTSEQPLLVVGPRSALFMPLRDIGLIVIDEAHEPAYKQDQQPHYYTPRVAAKLAQLSQAQLVIGTATPNISEYYLAESKGRPIIPMEQLAAGATDKPELMVVDIKDREKFNRSAYLSDDLIEHIGRSLSNQRQSLLYLNRRGTARLAFCQICGWKALCPNCDLNLTYHGDSHRLICHTCGYKASPFAQCPDCGNSDIIYKTAGTKAIAEEVQRLFPEARVMRFDTDNDKSESFEQHFADVRDGKVDILVGTQMLAKGLDLPLLDTLGIINADSSLGFPDFTAQERTYQLIRQVLGRIGRGHSHHSSAIVQTFSPDSPLLSAAMASDWENFYKTELDERQKFNFPPFSHLLKLSCRRASAQSSATAGEKLKTQLLQMISGIVIDGPAPAFIEKKTGKFEWQLVVKAKDRSKLLAVIEQLPSGWSYDIDPINLL